MDDLLVCAEECFKGLCPIVTRLKRTRVLLRTRRGNQMGMKWRWAQWVIKCMLDLSLTYFSVKGLKLQGEITYVNFFSYLLNWLKIRLFMRIQKCLHHWLFFSFRHGCDPLVCCEVHFMDWPVLFLMKCKTIKSGSECLVSYNANMAWLNLFQFYVYMSCVEIVSALVHYG